MSFFISSISKLRNCLIPVIDWMYSIEPLHLNVAVVMGTHNPCFGTVEKRNQYTLRKHTFTNILENVSTQKENFLIQILIFFLHISAWGLI